MTGNIAPAAVLIICLLFLSCAKNQNPACPESPGYGALQINIKLLSPNGLGKTFKTSATIWDKVVVQVCAADMDTLRDSLDLGPSDLTKSFILNNIKPGTGRRVSCWTVNTGNGAIVHTTTPQTVNTEAGKIALLHFTLTPGVGSIYLTFWDIDSDVDSVSAEFVTPTHTYQSRQAVASGRRIQLSLDYVPDNTNGTLSVYGINTDVNPEDTLYAYSTPLSFQSGADTTQAIHFTVSPGGISLDMDLLQPGVSLAGGYMNHSDNLDTLEAGPVYISEILYSANDSEYIEIYNPGSADTTFDTLIVEVNNTYRYFEGITVKADSFLVIGRQALPFADVFHPVKSALDLASTFEFIALRKKDSTLMDWVAFTGSSNDQQWPAMSSSAKTAIVLNSLPADPKYNNYGRHWVKAESIVPSSGIKGTPGTSGI